MINLKRGRPAGLYMVVAAATVFLPNVFAQRYLLTATGKLTALRTASDISKYPATKYYTIKNHYVYKEGMHTYYGYSIRSKGGVMDLDIYITCPIFDINEATANDTALTLIRDKNDMAAINPAVVDTGIREPPPMYVSPAAWACFYYGKTIDNKGTKAEKLSKRVAFYNKTMADFAARNVDSFTYVDRIGYNDRRRDYRKALDEANEHIPVAEQVLLEPRYKPFEERNGNKLPWAFGSFAICIAVWLAMILIPKLEKNAFV